jgi:hypothetical protein
MKYRNPTFTKHGLIDCEIKHPIYGWIPFTCDPLDNGAEFDVVALFDDMSPNASVYIAPTPPTYYPSNLSTRRFEYLLAYTGLDDVWAALETELKSTDRALYAQIKAQRSAATFSQSKTIGLVAIFAETVSRVAPDADLSEAAIKAAWIIAEQATL